MDPHIVDDFLAEEAANRQAADENVLPHQILEPGDFFIRRAHGFIIYGEVLCMREHLEDSRDYDASDEDDRADLEEEVSVYAEPHMRFYRFTKSYSALCPRGELGDIHLSTVEKKITAEEFQAAEKRLWR